MAIYHQEEWGKGGKRAAELRQDLPHIRHTYTSYQHLYPISSYTPMRSFSPITSLIQIIACKMTGAKKKQLSAVKQLYPTLAEQNSDRFAETGFHPKAFDPV